MRERWYPLLLAFYPVLFLYAHNSANLPIGVIGRSLVAALLMGLAALLCARLLIKDAVSGALLAAAMVIFWGTYGQFLALLPESGWVGKVLKHHRVLVPLGGFLLGALAYSLRSGRLPSSGIRFLTLGAKGMSLTLVGFSLFNIGMGLWKEARSPLKSLEGDHPDSIIAPVLQPSEDIYHIVLDGYPRADILHQLFGMDNSQFLEALGQRGFCIADSARSNYAQTLLSVLATMSGQYLAGEIPADNDGWAYRRHLSRRLKVMVHQRAKVVEGGWLRAFATGYSATEILDADEFLSPTISLNEFERALVALTPLDAVLNVVESRYGNILHRQRVEFTFENMAVPVGSQPRAFTFAHIVAPHPPFVYAPVSATSGSVVPMADGDHIVHEGGLSVEQYRTAYCAQVEAVNDRLLKAVDAILANGRPSVILVHGDHGPASLLQWEDALPSKDAAQERFSILLALRMGDGSTEACWPAMSPINAVRVMQNRLYGTRRDTLPDRSFFSTWSRPFEFVEIQ